MTGECACARSPIASTPVLANSQPTNPANGHCGEPTGAGDRGTGRWPTRRRHDGNAAMRLFEEFSLSVDNTVHLP